LLFCGAKNVRRAKLFCPPPFRRFGRSPPSDTRYDAPPSSFPVNVARWKKTDASPPLSPTLLLSSSFTPYASLPAPTPHLPTTTKKQNDKKNKKPKNIATTAVWESVKDVNEVDERGRTLLYCAARRGSLVGLALALPGGVTGLVTWTPYWPLSSAGVFTVGAPYESCHSHSRRCQLGYRLSLMVPC
jgi:hypothetical protein